MDVFTRKAADKNAETVGRATKRAARELTGDDGKTDLGNEFATLDRELPAGAVHRTKRPKDRNAIAVVDRGARVLQNNADKFQHNKDLTDRRMKAAEDAGLPSADERGEELQPSVRRRQRLGGVDSMTVRSTEGRKTLLKLALPAPQGSGNAAGRLTRRRPAGVRQLDDFLAFPGPLTNLKMIFRTTRPPRF